MSNKTEKICCVPSCKRPRSPGTPLHGFPNPVNEAERFRSWIYCIGGDILGLDDNYIYKYRNVCRKHFEGKFLLGTKRIAKTAIPTLNMPGTRRQPLSDITRSTVNIEGNTVNMPSTSRDNLVTAMPQSAPCSKTTLQKAPVKTMKDTTQLARKISKLKVANLKYSQRLKKAMILNENATFKKMLQKFTAMATIFTLMQFREIKKTKMARRFTHQLVRLFSEIQDIAINILRTDSHINNLKEYIKTILYIITNVEFITCKKQKKELIEFIFDLCTRFFVFNWCRDVNKLLNGTTNDVDVEDEIKVKCFDYFRKRSKK